MGRGARVSIRSGDPASPAVSRTEKNTLLLSPGNWEMGVHPSGCGRWARHQRQGTHRPEPGPLSMTPEPPATTAGWGLANAPLSTIGGRHWDLRGGLRGWLAGCTSLGDTVGSVPTSGAVFNGIT